MDECIKRLAVMLMGCLINNLYIDRDRRPAGYIDSEYWQILSWADRQSHYV